MSYVTFDYSLFCSQIPEYSDPVLYPQATVENFWNIGTNYISSYYDDYEGSRAFMLNLMAAHLIYLNALVTSGQSPTLTKSASVDKVTVGLEPPPIKSQFGWWLSTTPRGLQLNALLSISLVGGLYVSTESGRWGYV